MDAFVPTQAIQGLSDEVVVERVRAGEIDLYEVLIRRYNQRLFRVTRSMLRDDSEAEDVVQVAYVRAYEHPDGFSHESKFSTWLRKSPFTRRCTGCRNVRGRLIWMPS